MSKNERDSKVNDLKKIYVDYSQFGEKLYKLYQKILRGGLPSKIIGIASGGINLSRPLAEWLGIHHIGVSIHFYDENKNVLSKPFFASVPPIPKDWTDLLIVDDIVDSGRTIKYFIDKTGLKQGVNFRIASLHWNPKGKYGIKPDYFIERKPANSWIVYPWEGEFTETFEYRRA